MLKVLVPGLVSLTAFVIALPVSADLPDMTAEYVGKAQYLWEDGVVEATIRAKGQKMRIDISADELPTDMGTSLIFDFEANRFISFSTGKVPAELRMYLVISEPATPMINEEAVPVGTEVVAGLTCTNYEFVEQTETGEIESFRNCVTSDGIWLKGTDGDGEAIFTMKTVNRAPQPAALFEPPAGYAEMDMGSFGGFDLTQFGGGMTDGGDTGDGTESYGEKKIEEATDETKEQVEQRVDEERRKQVDKFLGKIFGN